MGEVAGVPTIAWAGVVGVKKDVRPKTTGTAKTRLASACTTGPFMIASRPLFEVDSVVPVPVMMNEPEDVKELADDEELVADDTI